MRKYHLSLKKCEHCGEEMEVNSNAQKYCDEPECRDDRYYSKKFAEKGLLGYIKFREKEG